MRLLCAWLACTMLSVVPAAAAADTTVAAQAMRSAAKGLLDATPTAQHGQLLQAFTLDARSDWHYTPRSRPGVPFKTMTPGQREAAQKLLATALSEPGLLQVRAVIQLEIALRELESFGLSRDPENYAFALFGKPDDEAWGWRIEGHHLSLHFTVARLGVVASLPQFIGANPAVVPRDIAGGPKRGQRALGEGEDRAFALLAALNPVQRQRAIFSERPFGDIVTRNAAVLEPLAPVGIAFSELDPAQQTLLLRVVEALAAVAEPSVAQQRLARVRDIGLDALRFGWAGSTSRGQPHYWRIQGPRWLIEWDNSGGNHIHTVWRDADADWGRDVLKEHYRKAHR